MTQLNTGSVVQRGGWPVTMPGESTWTRLHAADTWAAARGAPETLTLDVLHRVAWFLGFDLKVEFGPREAAS